MADLTPSQTIGPFFHEGMQWAVTAATSGPGAANVTGRMLDRDGKPVDDAAVTAATSGQGVANVIGHMLDRDGKPVDDAVLEVWQPGWSAAPFQRVYTGEGGAFAFAVPQPGDRQVHASVTIFTRGLTNGLFTRVYLHATGAPATVQLPPGVPRERAGTLIARREADGAYQWDIRLQGEGETVFFEV